MNWIKDLLEYLSKGIRFLVFIQPWQQGIRVRLGKNCKLLKSGTHLVIPVIDSIYIQPIRLRTMGLSPINLQTKDGIDVNIQLSLGYKIIDMLKMYNTIHQPQHTIDTYLKGFVAEYIRDAVIANLKNKAIEGYALNKLNNKDFGMEYDFVKVTTFTTAKVLRLIQEKTWSNDNDYLDSNNERYKSNVHPLSFNPIQP